jgi:hypothetical protein
MEYEGKISKKNIFSESEKSKVSHKIYFLQISYHYPIFKGVGGGGQPISKSIRYIRDN